MLIDVIYGGSMKKAASNETAETRKSPAKRRVLNSNDEIDDG